ncbi:MAG TPA: hypothetical protein PLK94_13685, partial [Alphaproteobacteria bacterium]|nr:hypothetical protein [Alphaproteobacteria bacterium]
MIKNIKTPTAAIVAAFCLVAGYAARPFLDADKDLIVQGNAPQNFVISNGIVNGFTGKECNASQFFPELGGGDDFSVRIGDAIAEKKLMDLFNGIYNADVHEKVLFVDAGSGDIYSTLRGGIYNVLNRNRSLVIAHATDFPNFQTCSVVGGVLPVIVVSRNSEGVIETDVPILAQMLSSQNEYFYMVDLS